MPLVLCINLVMDMIYDILYFKVVVIVAFFGGLRHCETMDLKIEKFNSSPEGIYVTHEREPNREVTKEAQSFSFEEQSLMVRLTLQILLSLTSMVSKRILENSVVEYSGR